MVIICNGGFVIGFIVLWLLHGIINDPIFLGVCVCVNSHWIPVVLKPNLAAPAFLTLPAPLHLQASGDNGQSHGQMSRRGCSCCYFGWLRWYIDVMCIYVCILLIYIYYIMYIQCADIYILYINMYNIYIYGSYAPHFQHEIFWQTPAAFGSSKRSPGKMDASMRMS